MMKPGDLVRAKYIGPASWPQRWRTKRNYSELVNVYQEDVGLVLCLSAHEWLPKDVVYWEVLVNGAIIYMAENYLEIIHN